MKHHGKRQFAATNNILRRLRKDLDEIKDFQGKPKRIYNAYKGYVLGTGIDTLERLLKTTPAGKQQKRVHSLLNRYREAEKSIN